MDIDTSPKPTAAANQRASTSAGPLPTSLQDPVVPTTADVCHG